MPSYDQLFEMGKLLFPADQLDKCYTATRVINPDIAFQGSSGMSFPAILLKELARLKEGEKLVSESGKMIQHFVRYTQKSGTTWF